jgi:phosphatidylserine decarboxylase
LTLTRYGTDVLWAILIIVVVLVGLALWTDEQWLRYILFAVAVFLSVFSLNFFRDPERTVKEEGRPIEKLVVCPADGKVVVVKETDGPEYVDGRVKLISIFMSPLDVHVNRSPMTGVVKYFRYVKGEFLVAHAPESSHRNERTLIGLETTEGYKILFAQVAGYIARRIVCPVKVGDLLHMGQRFGMIKFGSRVDIYLPLDANVVVKMGDIVIAGETVLAEFP